MNLLHETALAEDAEDEVIKRDIGADGGVVDVALKAVALDGGTPRVKLLTVALTQGGIDGDLLGEIGFDIVQTEVAVELRFDLVWGE